jgi:hypothetical protein
LDFREGVIRVDKKRVLSLLLAVAVVFGGAAASQLSAGTPKLRAKPKAPRVAVRHVNPRITRRFRTATWRWQDVMGLRRTHSSAALNTRRALRFWWRDARYARRLAAHVPHKSGWLCIHRYEGSWTDSGDPYWGGLQMDRGFMLAYAPRVLLRRGLANHWSPLEQMWVAERAHRSGRGFYAWPNTARYCGLV